MLRRIIVLALALVLMAPGVVFAASGGSGVNTTTQTTSTSTSTSHSSSTTVTDVGNIWMGYTINGLAVNTSHPDWDGSYSYSYTGNYNSVLELLLQGKPSSFSESGDYWAATHPAQQFVSEGGRGEVINEGPVQFMGSNNVALSATRYTDTTASLSQQVTTSTDVQSITIGDFILGTNTVVNTNTNTNTNYNDNYQRLTGNGQYDVYQVNSSCWVSPIVLDLSHTGRLDASEGSWLPHKGLKGKRLAMFNIRGYGANMLVEWVGPQMGLLVEPKADGTVDGSCLFGDQGGFDNGFQKLSVRDRNGDGVLSGDELKGLKVWTDLNGNARCDKGELRTLAELGITMLDLRHNNLRASFVMNGKREAMWDWWPTALDVRRVARATR